MTDTSSNLKLPFILPSQAQKYATHNEALQILDALVQLTPISSFSSVPPASPLAPPRHNKQLVQAVKAASDEYDLCLLLAPPIWSYQDISDLILAGKNYIVAIDMKAMKPAQISDLMCTLEVASSQPTGWILYNAPLEWVRREAAKRQVGRMDRRAHAVYG